MSHQKLTEALAVLKQVTKGEGIVSMNAEELTKYAEEQIAKATSDEDEGTARIAALMATIDVANVVLQKSATASVEFVQFAEKPEPGSNADLAKQLDEIKALLSKQGDQPEVTTIHPPPVPDGHNGGSVSTNQPQGDDNVAKVEATEAVATAKVSDDPAADEGPAKEQPAVKSDEFVWAVDMAKDAAKARTADITKRAAAPVHDKNAWGLDHEAPAA